MIQEDILKISIQVLMVEDREEIMNKLIIKTNMKAMIFNEINKEMLMIEESKIIKVMMENQMVLKNLMIRFNQRKRSKQPKPVKPLIGVNMPK